MRQGEIRWYTFKAPDKHHPVIVLIQSDVIPYLDKITIALITTTFRNIPSEVALSTYDGMPRDCAINFDHIQTVQKGKLGKLITTLSADKMEQVRDAISFSFNLNSPND